MTLKPYYLHPAAVHFPIALLAAGLAAAGARLHRRAPEWLAHAESWLLWLGTASAWAAVYLGGVAEEAAPHRPLAWEVLADHEALAWWTAGTFTVLSLLRVFVLKTRRDAGRWRALQLLLWAAGFALLFATAEHGGRLVYVFGLGVDAP